MSFSFVILAEETVAKLEFPDSKSLSPRRKPGSRMRNTLKYLLDPVSSTGRQLREKPVFGFLQQPLSRG